MSSDHPRTRPILPRTTPNDNPITPPLDPNAASGPSRVATLPSSRTNIRSACLACRRRRSRCSGGSPCTRCRNLDTECTYNETQDGRTRALRGRSKEELDLHKKVIDGLFRAVREGGEAEFLDMIRNNASLEDVAAAIDRSTTEAPDESASETPESPYSFPRENSDEHSTTVYPQAYPRDTFDASTETTVQTITLGRRGNRTSITSSTTMSGNLLSHAMMDPTASLIGIRHLLEPLHRSDGSDQHRLSTLYINFRDFARLMIGSGISAISMLGASGVSCGMFFTNQPSPLDVSTWAFAIVNDVPGLDIAFRLAWLCYVTRFMRWAVDPTEEHFNLMPEMMKPTQLQLSVPHPAVVDLIPIPQIRDSMIENFRDFNTVLRTAGASILWTGQIADAVQQDPLTGIMTISDRFERHVANVNNFCFGRNILDIFPELEGQLPIAEVDHLGTASLESSPLP